MIDRSRFEGDAQWQKWSSWKWTRTARNWRDVESLVREYRANFGWDVPGLNEGAADRLIFAAVRQTLDGMEQALPGASLP